MLNSPAETVATAVWFPKGRQHLLQPRRVPKRVFALLLLHVLSHHNYTPRLSFSVPSQNVIWQWCMIITLSFDLTENASPVPYIYIFIRAFNKMERKQTIFFFKSRLSWIGSLLSATQNICTRWRCTLFRWTLLRLTTVVIQFQSFV